MYSVYSVVLLICCAERSGDFDDGLGDARPAWFANQDAGISYHAIAVCRLVRFKVGLERLLKGGLLVLELFDFENYFDQCGALFFDLGFCELHVFVPFGLVVVGWLITTEYTEYTEVWANLFSSRDVREVREVFLGLALQPLRTWRTLREILIRIHFVCFVHFVG